MQVQSNMNRERIAVISGARAGIGRATAELLRSRGWQVLGIGRSDTDIEANLSQSSGRKTALAEVASKCPDGIDALITAAGVSALEGETVVSLNFFGTTELLLGLRNLLAKRRSPRVVVVSSLAAVLRTDPILLEALGAYDEPRAIAAARDNPLLAYATSKRALSLWVRHQAVTETWAGAGILINGVAPGLVNTDFIHKMQADPVIAERLKQAPRALKHLCEPEEIAHLIAFLASPENTNLVAQTIFSDGGGDAIVRADHL